MAKLLRRILHTLDRFQLSILSTSIALILLVVVLWPHSVVRVDSGHAGALWRRFFNGTDMQRTYSEGTHLILPWNIMYVYDTRYQTLAVGLSVLLPDNLTVKVEAAVVYRLNASAVNVIHRLYGPNYQTTFLKPLFIRELNNAVQAVPDITEVSKSRHAIDIAVKEKLEADMVDAKDADGFPQTKFIFAKVVISDVTLPEELARIITNRSIETVRAQTYPTLIDNTRSEAERKLVEGKGIRAFQSAVGADYFENFLRNKTIDAALALAQSPNSKVVVFGGNSQSLPIILDDLSRGLGPLGIPAPPGKVPSLSTPAPQGRESMTGGVPVLGAPIQVSPVQTSSPGAVQPSIAPKDAIPDASGGNATVPTPATGSLPASPSTPSNR